MMRKKKREDMQLAVDYLTYKYMMMMLLLGLLLLAHISLKSKKKRRKNVPSAWEIYQVLMMMRARALLAG